MSQDSGLRERKRIRTMRHIQEAALALFEAHGFAAVTVERIAAEAEVSPSSVYRYFDTKEGVVLWNRNQPELTDRLATEHTDLPVLEAARRILADYFTAGDEWDESPERRRVRVLLASPEAQAAAVSRAALGVDALAAALAMRSGAGEPDFRMRVTAGAVLGGLLAAVRAWQADGGSEPLPELLDRTFTTLQQGLDLEAGALPQ